MAIEKAENSLYINSENEMEVVIDMDESNLNTYLILKELKYISENIKYWSDDEVEQLREFYIVGYLDALDHDDLSEQFNCQTFLWYLSVMEVREFN